MVSALGKTTRRETSLEPEPGSVTLRGFSQANTTVTASSAAETAATRSFSRATRFDSLNRKGIVLRSCHSDGQKKSRQRYWDFAGGPARSEERRVGKECRSRWWLGELNKKVEIYRA